MENYSQHCCVWGLSDEKEMPDHCPEESKDMRALVKKLRGD